MKTTATKLSVLAFLGLGMVAYGQSGKVGVNISSPRATLDVQPNATNSQDNAKTNEGILAPKLSKIRVASIETPIEGTLVYVIDDATKTNGAISNYTGNDTKVAKITEKGYYYYNGTEWVRKEGNNDDIWINNTAGTTVKIKNLSDGVTSRTDDKNVFINDNGFIGIQNTNPDRQISIIGDQPSTDELGQIIVRTTDNSTSNAGITLLSKNAHASLKMGSGEESDGQIIFDTSGKFENNDYSNTYNMFYPNNISDRNKRYLAFKSNIHPESHNVIYFNVLGRLGLGVKEPTEKIDAYNPTGFTIIKTGNDLGVSKFGTRDSGNTYIGFQNKFQIWNSEETLRVLDITSNGNMGVGVVDPTEKLEVAGNVKATGFIGANAAIFPDYVFQKYYTGTSSLKADYSFKTLSQVEDFVKTNGHLPGYKSAAEIKKQGYIDLMATQLTNVEKIEELYLHLLEKDKEVKALKAEITELKSLVKDLLAK
ncbi:hypothetical protein PG623_07330 [Riemerella anatipestifer]|nr:hypothetical protein [Riemerella anatipestifer]